MKEKTVVFDIIDMIDKKDIMPANDCTKPFAGINLAKNRIALIALP